MALALDATKNELCGVSPRPPTFGCVNPGWSPIAWARECHRKAWACWQAQPEIAGMWLEWAFAVVLDKETQA